MAVFQSKNNNKNKQKRSPADMLLWRLLCISALVQQARLQNKFKRKKQMSTKHTKFKSKQNCFNPPHEILMVQIPWKVLEDSNYTHQFMLKTSSVQNKLEKMRTVYSIFVCKNDKFSSIKFHISSGLLLSTQYRLVGLVIKASATRAEDPQFESCLRQDFSWVESYQWHWHSSGYPARRLLLLGQCWDWLAWCQYTVIGWDGKFDLQLLSQCGRSVLEIHSHVAGTLSKQQTSKLPTHLEITIPVDWALNTNH